jgi:hypothetical protein
LFGVLVSNEYLFGVLVSNEYLFGVLVSNEYLFGVLVSNEYLFGVLVSNEYLFGVLVSKMFPLDLIRFWNCYDGVIFPFHLVKVKCTDYKCEDYGIGPQMEKDIKLLYCFFFNNK